MILHICNTKSFSRWSIENKTDYIQKAELLWIKYSQLAYHDKWETHLTKLGPRLNEHGIIVVGERLSHGLTSWNTELPMILPRNCEYARLYCMAVHYEDHGGVEATIVKVRSRIWIPRIRNLIRDIKKRCVECRKIDKIFMQQKMSPLPAERLNPSPAFYHSAVDPFGPFSVKDMIKKRTTGKAYGVIFNCLYTRAVYVDLVEGYDTRSFILSLRRFVSLRGYPGTMRADRGSQIVSASKELQDLIKNTLKWETIYTFGEQQGMKWILNKSADAPWQNGCSEALIKSIKNVSLNLWDQIFFHLLNY